MNKYYELNPFIQISLDKNGMILNLPLENKIYECEDSNIISILNSIQKIAPCKIDDIIECFYTHDEIDNPKDYCLDLIESSILIETIKYNSIKSGIRYWLDHGWIDALVLHMCTRDMEYEDDPNKDTEEESIETIIENSIPLDYKKYDTINLDKSGLSEIIPAEKILDAIMGRRSFKTFDNDSLPIKNLSDILANANKYGAHNTRILEEGTNNRDIVYDSAFSALDTYIVVYDVEDLEDGLYFYDKKTHQLIIIKLGKFENDISKICIGQQRAGSGVCTFIIAANWDKYQSRYKHSRAYRNLLINTAEFAQHYLILATHFGYNTFLTPALIEEEAYSFLECPLGIAPLYVVSIG